MISSDDENIPDDDIESAFTKKNIQKAVSDKNPFKVSSRTGNRRQFESFEKEESLKK